MREKEGTTLSIALVLIWATRVETEVIEDRLEDADAENVELVSKLVVRPRQTPDLWSIVKDEQD